MMMIPHGLNIYKKICDICGIAVEEECVSYYSLKIAKTTKLQKNTGSDEENSEASDFFGLSLFGHTRVGVESNRAGISRFELIGMNMNKTENNDSKENTDEESAARNRLDSFVRFF